MRYSKKKYKSPKKLWDKNRIEKDREVMKQFGLRRKREIWIAESEVRKYRRFARELAARRDEEKEAILIGKMVKLGLLQSGATLDDVLDLTTEKMLNRRLQTVVFRKGLTKTVKEARQFIVHGRVTIDGKRVVYPNYIVPVEEEARVQKVAA